MDQFTKFYDDQITELRKRKDEVQASLDLNPSEVLQAEMKRIKRELEVLIGGKADYEEKIKQRDTTQFADQGAAYA